MGTCPSAKFPGSNPKKIPSFYYLDRKRQKIYFIEPGKVTSSQFQSSMVFPYDAAIAYIQDSCILIAGGTYLGQLISRVTLIDPKNKKVRFLSSLPTPAKEGRLFEYQNWIYYVGAVSKAILHPRSSQEEPAPLMRYDVKKNRWEYFTNSKTEELIKRNVQGKSEEDIEEIKALEFNLKHLTLRDLLLPGSFMIAEKIYFVGGFIMDDLGRLVQNNQVFSLNLKDRLQFKAEPFQLPFYVLRPICSSGSKHVIITGGVNPSSGRPNECSCILTITDSVFKFTPLDILEVTFYETCCPIYQDYCVFFPRYPKVPVRGKKCKEWKLFDIRKERKKKFIETKGFIKKENDFGEAEIPPIKRIRKMIINFDICVHKEERIESIKKVAELDEEEIDIYFEESEEDGDSEIPDDQLSGVSEGIIIEKGAEVKKIKRKYYFDSEKSLTSPKSNTDFEFLITQRANKLYEEEEIDNSFEKSSDSQIPDDRLSQISEGIIEEKRDEIKKIYRKYSFDSQQSKKSAADFQFIDAHNSKLCDEDSDPGSISELSQVSEGVMSNKNEMIRMINKKKSADRTIWSSTGSINIGEVDSLIQPMKGRVNDMDARLRSQIGIEDALEIENSSIDLKNYETPDTKSKDSSIP